MTNGQQQQTDVKALAKTLSDSYSALSQHTALSKETVEQHLSQLAQYSEHLPLSWFTQSFVDALLGLAADHQLHAYTLLSVWLRRLPDTEPQVSRALERMAQGLAHHKDAWIGLVSMAGRGRHDEAIVEALVRALNNNNSVVSDETVDASVAHFLAETSLLNALEVDQVQKLLEAYVARRGLAVLTVMQHVTDVRMQKAKADMEVLVQLVETMARQHPQEPMRLAPCVGVVRMMQFAKIKRFPQLQRKAEALLAELLDQSVSASLNHAREFAKNQDTIAFLAGQCIPNMPKDILQKMNHKNMIRVLVSCLLTSSNVWQNGQMISNLKADKEHVKMLTELGNGWLHKEVGRVSRAAGAMIQTALDSDGDDQDILGSSLDRLVGFSYNLFIDWNDFVVSHSAMDEETKKELDAAVWLIFKTILFSFTAILKSVAADTPNGKGLVAVRDAAENIVSVYANLHFITERLGSFKAYQDNLTNAVAYLTQEKKKLNNLISQAYKEYAPSQFTSDTTHPTSLLTPVQQSRLTFFTNLIEQVMKHLDDKVLEDRILPVIYPILKWKKDFNKDLYESAHAAVLSVFAAQKPVSRELAGVYAKIMLESYPGPMTLHQLRFAYTSMVQSLCQMDDAIAWLATNCLLEKIEKEEDDPVVLSQYTTALIDLIKPLSLGPFLGELLASVERLVLRQPAAEMRTATLKIVFDTVSGPGISDMRRTETVGWFLQLRRKVQQVTPHQRHPVAAS